MRRMKTFFLIAFVALSTVVYSQEMNADLSKSTLKWNAKKVSGEHYGSIKLKNGKFEIKNDQIVNGYFVIDMESIVDEDLTSPEWNQKLINHLKSDDFFGVSTFKTTLLSNLKSTKFQNNKAMAEGDLTIKGQTLPVKFEITRNGDTYKAQVVVDRTKYNIRYGSGKFFENLGDNMIYDDFTINVEIVANK